MDHQRVVSANALFRVAKDDTLDQETGTPGQPEADLEAHANNGIGSHSAGTAYQSASCIW